MRAAFTAVPKLPNADLEQCQGNQMQSYAY